MNLYLVCFLIIFSFKTFSQDKENSNEALFLGLNYGQAAQNRFPFDNPNYLYTTEFVKVQINYRLAKKKLTYELLIEPSLYFSNHQLLNKFFLKPGSQFDTEEQREKLTSFKSFQEYALNFGIVLRYDLTNSLSTYALGSVGPMISTTGTERLRKGFAFSDILGFGLSYKYNRLLFDVRLTFRHNSNANLYRPNNGHNSVGFESGISFRIK